METTILYPDRKLRTKFYILWVLLALVVLAVTMGFGYLIGNEEGGRSGAALGMQIAVGVNALWLLPVLAFIGPYYKSLRYEIHPDEVIVRAGIITRSVKHVPFRTVTNLTVKRGPLDRLFGLGTFTIQTAGASGDAAPEETLLGLVNYDEVYNRVAEALRRFRRAMSPTAADEEREAVIHEGDILRSLLVEVKAIREGINHK